MKESKDGFVVITKDGQESELPATDVILALGYRANATLYEELLKTGAEVYNIGDSKQPKDIMTGIWDAYEVCSHL